MSARCIQYASKYNNWAVTGQISVISHKLNRENRAYNFEISGTKIARMASKER